MQSSGERDARAAKLSAVLDEHRDALTRLDGVIGSGVGLSAGDAADNAAVVIQIFVSPSASRKTVERQVAQILGREYPMEVVYMPVPRGESDERENER